MKGETDMEDKAMQVVQGVKPNVVNWIGAAIGAALAWWTGLPPLAQALLIVQGADIVTGLGKALCVAQYSGRTLKPIQPERARKVYAELLAQMTFRQRLRLYVRRLIHGLRLS